jgi:hypothetical protein
MLKGKQKNLDANKNGKIDAGDFPLLKKKKASKGKASKPTMNRKKGM